MFEYLYGYKVSEELFKWIYLSALSGGVKAFSITHKAGKTAYNSAIFPSITFDLNEKSILEAGDIPLIFSTTPYIQIGRGGGIHYCCSTIKEKRRALYCIDEEDPFWIFKSNTIASKIISEQLTDEEKKEFRKFKKAFSSKISKPPKELNSKFYGPGLARPNTSFSLSTSKINENVEKGRLGYDLHSLRITLIREKKGRVYVKLLISQSELINYLTNKESEYYLYDTVVGRINSEVVRTLFIYFFAQKNELLNDLLDHAIENIKGKMYLNFVKNFKKALRENSEFSFLKLKDVVTANIEI